MTETLPPPPEPDPTALEPRRADDSAVVAGINGYPMLKSVQGAEHDAAAFRDWLIDPAGGNLQPARVTTIRSGDYPAALDLLDTKPIADDVYRAFRRLHQRAKNRPDRSKPF